MMKAPVRYGVLVPFLALGTACTGSAPPTAPTPTAAATPAPTPDRSPDPSAYKGTFPSISAPARVYVGVVNDPYSPMHGSPLASRYVLYDDGTFALQYSSANYPFFEYRGTYTEASAVVTFEWEGWSAAGPWGASGSLTGDTLTVRYNEIMLLTDFVDGVFIRQR